ncbi:winged helix-turn-helix domain-containing protein [Actinomycetota bacterium Odt1-20B]
MSHPTDAPQQARWRQRTLRALPQAVLPLRDLVPAGQAPRFLDVFSDDLAAGLDAVRAARADLVRAELERVYAPHPAAAPSWVRELHRGSEDSWRVLLRAERAAFETVVRPVWPVVQDLHRAEFTRHAVAVAEEGLGAALSGLTAGARLHGNVWELGRDAGGAGGAEGERDGDIVLGGRGVLLMPTFHWTGAPLLADLPGQPLVVTYSAGPGHPLTPDGPEAAEEGALAGVLGRTRADVLLLLAEDHTTTDLARRLGVSNATASAHAAALRGAGLVVTVRAGRAVRHRRTAMGDLLVQGRAGGSSWHADGDAGHSSRSAGITRVSM